MTLQEAIDRYIDWQRSHGAKFETSAHTLQRFAKGIGGDIACDEVARSQVLAHLAGKGPLTRYRKVKYSTLSAFYRYAISRGYASSSPLPLRDDEPKPPSSRPGTPPRNAAQFNPRYVRQHISGSSPAACLPAASIGDRSLGRGVPTGRSGHRFAPNFSI